jgi:hypothetical protein
VAAPRSLSWRLPDGLPDSGFGDGGFVATDGVDPVAPAIDSDAES